MSKGFDGNPKLDLKLNLSPPLQLRADDSSSGQSSPLKTCSMTDSASHTTAESSCMSSDREEEITSSVTNSNKVNDGTGGSSSNRLESEDGGMMLVGCPRCLMYVILSEVNPKCPICKSSVLLDLVSEVKSRSTK